MEESHLAGIEVARQMDAEEVVVERSGRAVEETDLGADGEARRRIRDLRRGDAGLLEQGARVDAGVTDPAIGEADCDAARAR